MKIISKFKDYYDYLQGVYGIDERIVYDRRDKNYSLSKEPNEFVSDINPIKCYTFAICGTIYIVHTCNGKFYFGNEIPKI